MQSDIRNQHWLSTDHAKGYTKEIPVYHVNKKNFPNWLKTTFFAGPHMHEEIEHSFWQITKVYSQGTPE